MRLTRFLVKALLVLGLVLSLSGSAGAEEPGRASGGEAFRPGHLIVKFRSSAAREERLEALGLRVVGELPALSLALVAVPEGWEEEYRRYLAAQEGVEYAELDHLVWAQDVTPNDPFWSSQWGLPKIRAPAAWEHSTGGGNVVIAIVDTGIDLGHPDLASKLWTDPIGGNHGWDFVNDDSDPQDDYGHGTHVAGIAAAATNNGIGVAGVSWGARLMAVKVVDATGNGSYYDVAQGVVYAVDKGAKVINLSLGGDYDDHSLQDAVNYAASHRALVIAAAGNYHYQDNPQCRVVYPAAYSASIAVAATDRYDQRASYSCSGPQVDIAAPGDSIWSTVPGGYGYKSGTSMATPFVSGLSALLWSYCPCLSAAQVRSFIETTAADVNSASYPGWDQYLGWGRMDAYGALRALSAGYYLCRYRFLWVSKRAS